ncbi:3-hydroxybutyryl-CoA dehydrogenase/5-formyl-3-hydroxy-2-methylpyridine 4-carboxylate dehydrogenase [Tistlia consotensis]|uniref:3-hydroxybutyryl-CoA dehydrogenase/5-formyl-3-hydroxy-2-methylpyridine 4-carboxylate dehydrogenase n=1 Tax=Tistlia consotensis USBA 355 TaxID=560819 RepID=A0A1Y6CIH4_9PROT|nr:5-formyl-3-hydroxy-2-methylpyridine 4-carboxylate 5-dehydrogenase [Tistlia consotensis]SMF57351.1 3-hydroxybutyryl-CoA dehydrogenase/5-formyl-3-hydroxy-2-methylpyridine 4-carboxylate dehydrogenase [Tistlia consotensis USBA 355]SNR45617.1 3-hydroxybutyryl-CoA dehydrogenase/5-formyl-3-hydroxy-2-methylpyridine 4-carboxylate dehydrogenase [Tistlia consotensis]
MTIAAVIGLGTMGAGIAAVLARGGLTVRACDTAPAAVERARGELPAIAGLLDRLGTPARGDATAVAFAGSLEEAVAGADLVLENVPEKLELKQQVFRQIDAAVGTDCIIASDTSGIPITKLQAVVSRPERVVGMHWSNPPHLIPMIEVVAGRQTGTATRDWMVALIRGLGLLPVVVKKDVPGFVENRVLYAIMREALDLVEEGVIEPEDLDTCVSWGIGYKLAIVGPMKLLDMAGLDIYQSVASYLNPELSRRADVSGAIAERIGRGRLGLKSGAGLFDYAPGELQSLRAERANRFVAVRKALTED